MKMNRFRAIALIRMDFIAVFAASFCTGCSFLSSCGKIEGARLQTLPFIDPIHQAILDENTTEIEVSLAHGIDPNGVYRYDYFGHHIYRNPLEFAIASQSSNIVSILLDYGGIPTAATVFQDRSAWRAIDEAYAWFQRQGYTYPLASFLAIPFSCIPDKRVGNIPSRYLLQTVIETSYPAVKPSPIHLFVDAVYLGTFPANNRHTDVMNKNGNIDSTFWERWLSNSMTNYFYATSCWVVDAFPKFMPDNRIHHGLDDYFESLVYALNRDEIDVKDISGCIWNVHFDERVVDHECVVQTDRIWVDRQSLYLQTDWDCFIKTNNWWIRVRK